MINIQPHDNDRRISDETCRRLVDSAVKVREYAYAKYSGFKVGAALLCDDGRIYTGCNIENSSYPATICAERVAFSSAISEGERNFVAIAVVGGSDCAIGVTPCGICRQVMSEFCKGDFEVITLSDDGKAHTVYTLSDLLPHAFDL